MRADAGRIPPRSLPASTALPRVDGRTRAAKRAKRLTADFMAALGGDVSPVQVVRIKRAVELLVAAEGLRARSLRGEQVDYLELVRLENLANRDNAVAISSVRSLAGTVFFA